MNTHNLYVTNQKESLIVIDGQHRILGIDASNVDKSSFELLVSFILGEDRSIIAKHFYTINYTQKGVNKSLLYQLMGEFGSDLDEISFLHEIVMALNETSVSPFFKRIKMLGRSNRDLSPKERSLQTLSQAFMVDYLLYTILLSSNMSKRKNQKLLPIFYWYYKNSKPDLMLKFLIRFFTAFHNIFPQMKLPESPLGKTLGIGAMLQFASDFFIKILVEDELMQHPEKIDELRAANLQELLAGVELVDLDSYPSSGAAGVGRLRQALCDNCIWLNKYKPGYTSISDYREQYIQWLMEEFPLQAE